jgi:hypothetical protein
MTEESEPNDQGAAGNRHFVQSARRRSGCVLRAMVLCAALLMGAFGVGLPYRYWYRPKEVQVMDGAGEVAVFVDVYRSWRRYGLLESGHLGRSATIFKAVVSADGTVNVTKYTPTNGISINPNIYPLACLHHDRLLVENAQPANRRLIRLGAEGRLELVDLSNYREIQDLFLSESLICQPVLDELSESSGWIRLRSREVGSAPVILTGEAVESQKNGVRIRVLEAHGVQSIVAESLTKSKPWRRTLLSVDTSPWVSYRPP